MIFPQFFWLLLVLLYLKMSQIQNAAYYFEGPKNLQPGYEQECLLSYFPTIWQTHIVCLELHLLVGKYLQILWLEAEGVWGTEGLKWNIMP